MAAPSPKLAELAEKLKAQGNELFAKRNYRDALKLYTAAIKADANNHILYSNRSLCQLQLGDYASCIDDANQANLIAPSFAKSYFTAGQASVELRRYVSARQYFQKYLELNPSDDAARTALATAEKEHIDSYYPRITKDQRLVVQYFDAIRGKGVAAKSDLTAGDPILIEVPLVSHRDIRDIGTDTKKQSVCSFCLKSKLSSECLEPHSDLYSVVYANGEPQNYLSCPGCASEIYCSSACQDMALQQYHKLLCTHSDPDHPIAKLYQLAKAHNRTNPLLIARIFAIVISRIRAAPEDDPERAYTPFGAFISNEEVSPDDEKATELIRAALAPHCPSLTYVTLSNYRRLNGAILRNASTIQTSSDLHTVLTDPSSTKKLARDFVIKALGCSSPEAALASPYLQSKSVNAIGLFAIANSMNHSCEPNVALVSPFNNFKLKLVMLRPVKKGDELLISYIDENAPVEERQRKLQEAYLFKCTCRKCKEGR